MPRIRRLLIEARQGLGPHARLSDDRLAAVARRCGAAEIAEALAELGRLAREKAALPDWDGDAQVDVAMAQETFADILGHVDHALVAEVAKGLAAPEADTRGWTALALEMHGGAAALPPLRAALAAESDAAARDMVAGAIARLEH